MIFGVFHVLIVFVILLVLIISCIIILSGILLPLALILLESLLGFLVGVVIYLRPIWLAVTIIVVIASIAIVVVVPTVPIIVALVRRSLLIRVGELSSDLLRYLGRL